MAQQASRIDKLSFGGERLVDNWLVHLKPSSFRIATECEMTSIAHPITRDANFLTLWKKWFRPRLSGKSDRPRIALRVHADKECVA